MHTDALAVADLEDAVACRPVLGPLPAGALAALAMVRGELVMLLDAGAQPQRVSVEAAQLLGALAAADSAGLLA